MTRRAAGASRASLAQRTLRRDRACAARSRSGSSSARSSPPRVGRTGGLIPFPLRLSHSRPVILTAVGILRLRKGPRAGSAGAAHLAKGAIAQEEQEVKLALATAPLMAFSCAVLLPSRGRSRGRGEGWGRAHVAGAGAGARAGAGPTSRRGAEAGALGYRVT